MIDSKIGIITHFHNSLNYGGVLQAYSLSKFLSDNGFSNKQILFDSKKSVKTRITIKHRVANFFFRLLLRKRIARFHKFRKRVPQTLEIFDFSNISRTNNYFDVFITGSDQVWNFKWFSEEYFLTFVESNKTKLSYAASFGSDYLDNSKFNYLKEVLKEFKAVSVREPGLINDISSRVDKKVHFVVDPTLLISSKYWDEVVQQRIVKEKYMFCYFLGENDNLKILAKKYALKNNLIIVNIPFAAYRLNISDILYSNKRLFGADPFDFLSLIKYSDAVFTDSFHAVIFSNIFKKNFYAFSRDSDSSMDNRMKNIVDLFQCESRFIEFSEYVDCEYLSSLKSVDYSNNISKIDELKSISVDFLMKNLND